jgi:proline iminopeptidase
VTTSRRAEADWLYRGLSRFFPEAWERFRNHVPEAARDEDVVTFAAEQGPSARCFEAVTEA